MTKISGTLIDGAGNALPNVQIVLTAIKTSNTVLNQTKALITTTSDAGKYNINVEIGSYAVTVLRDGFPIERVGTIEVLLNSKSGTLNDFLLLPKTGQTVTSDLLQQISNERKLAQTAATSAKKSADDIPNSYLSLKKGGTVTGQVIMDYASSGIKFNTENSNIYILRPMGNNLRFMYYDQSISDWRTKLQFASSENRWEFIGVDSVKVNGANVITTSNISNHALPKTGGTITGKANFTVNPTINNVSILKQGDAYPNYRLIANGVDLNTLTGSKFGIYYQYKSASASLDLNYPIRQAGNLVVYQNCADSNDGCTQIYYLYKPSRIFVRNYAASTKTWTIWTEFITTSNSTVDSNGFLKAASPILRLYAEKPESADGFTQAGYGLVNSDAKGVCAKKIGIGHYEIHGSLGFAKEGWYIEQPKDANGNVFSFLEYSTDENNVITVKTYTKKFDYETCNIVAGELADIKEGRWIDLRLEMPIIETVEQTELIPSLLNPII